MRFCFTWKQSHLRHDCCDADGDDSLASDSDGEVADGNPDAMASSGMQAQPQAMQSEDMSSEEEAGDEDNADTEEHRQKRPDGMLNALQAVS